MDGMYPDYRRRGKARGQKKRKREETRDTLCYHNPLPVSLYYYCYYDMTDSYYIDIPLSKVRVLCMALCIYVSMYLLLHVIYVLYSAVSKSLLSLLYERKEVTSRKKRKESSGLTITSIYFVHTYVVSPDDNNSFQSFFPPCNHIKALNNESKRLRRTPC